MVGANVDRDYKKQHLYVAHTTIPKNTIRTFDVSSEVPSLGS